MLFAADDRKNAALEAFYQRPRLRQLEELRAASLEVAAMGLWHYVRHG